MCCLQFPLTSLREIRVLKRLYHENIVNLIDVVVGKQRERCVDEGLYSVPPRCAVSSTWHTGEPRAREFVWPWIARGTSFGKLNRIIFVAWCQRSVFLCFEYCRTDLASLLDLTSRSNSTAATASGQSRRQRDSVHLGTASGLFTERHVKSILQQLLRAVAHVHDNWIMHRDIKMSNLLYHDGVVKLADFGLARYV